MKRKIFVHIGLPKTATTSLQRDLFPRLDNLAYAGVSHPRSSLFDTSTIYGAFMVSMYTGETEHFERALERIDPNKEVLISEEMITVVTGQSDWKQNLKNLQSLLNEYDYRLLVTVRSPLDGMFSYYVERYDYFRSNYRTFDEQILSSLDMGIYRYQDFFGYLNSVFDSARIYVAKYERIVNHDFVEVEDFLGIKLPVNTCLQNHNSKAKGSGQVYLKKDSNLYDSCRRFLRMKLNGNLRNSYLKCVGNIVKPVLARFSWKRSIPILSAEDRARLSRVLAEDINEYNHIS